MNPRINQASERFSRPTSRRAFLQKTWPIVGGLALSRQLSWSDDTATGRRWTAAIIGHTGRGDYGHEHDLIFNDRANIEVLAVADPVAEGRAKAALRSKAKRQYEGYREMLEREQPHLVCIAPRWTDQHHAMGMAAINAGAHIYLEKPFTRTLQQADELLAAATAKKRKIVVAHQMPLAPSIQHLKGALTAGLIGDLLRIRAHGKQDRRAGGEDMIVLGSHVFDLMRYLAGDVASCTAYIRQQGKDVTAADIHPAGEDLGPIVGDEIEAQFIFASGAFATFTSRAAYRETAGPWGMELVGSKGAVRILTEISPKVFVLKSGNWNERGRTMDWQPLEGDPSRDIPPTQLGFREANQRLVDNWLKAILEDRAPVCSGERAMKAQEMIMGVFEAGLNQSRVAFPLAKRTHPLARK